MVDADGADIAREREKSKTKSFPKGPFLSPPEMDAAYMGRENLAVARTRTDAERRWRWRRYRHIDAL